MTSQKDGALAVIGALFVLFSAMFDPRLSVVLGVGFLILFAIYKLIENRGQHSQP